ncbi:MULTISPECIES: hypothetical protein [Methylosinus]|uniref:Uncharacterized protein n=1 Tax=Methylosinus trichosporium (strain ATCC 35070 / NCIMB 11131 / UNIQEM 75 / OB3b) TaxID=595536 RepID=A0A2D2CZP2_METT3|nr:MULTISPECIES: hypothetical protein [Methylosinus]ATQ68099.1 hypothetical protein CQW49_09495 [Methylosinus trichosporium OB3b]OBS54342.1 hypothetical protein A8B73_00985 [Methylosinus sp. 3S-1]
MKTPLLILTTLVAGLSLTRADAGPFSFPLFDWLSPGQEEPTPGKSGRRAASPEALCREVDVAVDEGYGVSSREKRVICEDDR